ncbi:MAG: biotin--[acetyl-CoA-carboxylase] ligase [Chloroflexi bacterium]|nr:biotin--[acetyl-CoA-carboxylase] ligase [Chloroflexota bacterium]
MSDLSVDGIKARLTTATVGRNFIYLPQTGSTNEVAKQLAGQGAPEGTLVIAEEQTAGKGRLGRRWLAPAGTSLLLSLIFYPNLPPTHVGALTMICGLAVLDALEETAGLVGSLKWPNDILLNERKAGGILTELAVRGERIEYVIVGLGLNVNLRPAEVPGLPPDTTSVSEAAGRPVNRGELLLSLLAHVERHYLSLQHGHLPHREWASRLSTLGQQIVAMTPEGTIVGLARDVDETGALLILTPEGNTVRLLAGDVTLCRKAAR